MSRWQRRTDVRFAASGATAIPLCALVALACTSSSLESRSNVTLLVTNGTCQAGPCTPLQILGFPSNQPLTPGGLWSIDLGLLTAPTACLTFPRAAIFRVIGVSSDGTKADTTTFTWTTALPLSITGSVAAAGAPLNGFAEHQCVRAGGRGGLDRALAVGIPSLPGARLFTLKFFPG
jgi:hypothetical protein